MITQLICHFCLDFSVIEKHYKIQFKDYFADELQMLQGMQQDGLLTMDDQGIVALTAGRLLIRNLCMCFDRYLNSKTQQF